MTPFVTQMLSPPVGKPIENTSYDILHEILDLHVSPVHWLGRDQQALTRVKHKERERERT